METIIYIAGCIVILTVIGGSLYHRGVNEAKKFTRRWVNSVEKEVDANSKISYNRYTYTHDEINSLRDRVAKLEKKMKKRKNK